MMKRWHRRSPSAWLRLPAITCGLAVALPAWAQEFVKVEDGAREQLPAIPLVAAAYGFIWLAVLAYLLVTARGLGRVQKDLESLRRRLQRSESTGGPLGS